MIFTNLNKQNLCTNSTTENYQKFRRNVVKKTLLFIPIKPDLLIWEITFFIEFQAMPIKYQFRIEELLFGIRQNKI